MQCRQGAVSARDRGGGQDGAISPAASVPIQDLLYFRFYDMKEVAGPAAVSVTPPHLNDTPRLNKASKCMADLSGGAVIVLLGRAVGRGDGPVTQVGGGQGGGDGAGRGHVPGVEAVRDMAAHGGGRPSTGDARWAVMGVAFPHRLTALTSMFLPPRGQSARRPPHHTANSNTLPSRRPPVAAARNS
ncbi:hypothetical protein E2C01_085876 [Portunus trituberculatus]|uniref:Uncharacterized protein n=1 Tax=Portunus trituberculatus TaxID=210409 RepID=A0A5B7J3W4_PORTR|nr:hypothetical protein [Portunus trituberculatus]